MLDRLKRFCLVTVVVGTLGTFASVAPAGAQDSEGSMGTKVEAPAPTPAVWCHGTPPAGVGWNIVSFQSDQPGVACRQCLVLAAAIAYFYETWCWEVTTYHALLYYR